MTARKKIITAAMALGFVAGSAGLASAFTTARQSDTSVGNSTTADVAESDDANEPALGGSIQMPEDESLSEQDEAAALAAVAKVTAAEATRAALDANPGATLVRATLGNDNGSVVYEVQLTDAAGASIEVKVDAGNGAVLAQESGDDHEGDGADDREGDEADGVDHEHEGAENGENGTGVADANEASETGANG